MTLNTEKSNFNIDNLIKDKLDNSSEELDLLIKSNFDDLKESITDDIISLYQEDIETLQYELETLQDTIKEISSQNLQEQDIFDLFHERVDLYRKGQMDINNILK